MKTILLYIASFLVVVACEKQEVDLEALDQEVKQLHLDTYKDVNDSTVVNLYKVKKLYEQYPELPDNRHSYNNRLFGIYYRNKGNIDSAAYYFFRAAELAPDTLTVDRNKDNYNFYNAWASFDQLKKHGDALSVCRMFERSIPEGDSIKLQLLYYMYGTTYFNSLDYDKAFDYNEKQIFYEKKTGSDSTNAGARLRSARILFEQRENFSQAEDIFKELIKESDNFPPDQNELIYGSYAVLLYKQGNYTQSLKQYKESIKYTKLVPDSYQKQKFLSTSYMNMSEVSIDLKQYNSAKKYLDSSIAQGVMKVNPEIKKEILKNKLRLSVLLDNDLTKAMQTVDSIEAFLDKDYRAKYDQELLALTKANETEKELLAQQQQDQIDKLKLQTRLFLVLGFAALLIALGLLFYRQRKLRFERTSLQMQQRLLRSQMNPHFTFNTLYAIQRQIKEAPAKAHDYLLKFSRLLRLILENSMQNYVLLEDELESLRKYLDLQLLRFPDKFDYKIELVEIEEDDPLYIPPMLIQPFVENAIEHGFSGIDYKGQLTIRLEMKSKYVSCRVQDNGKGMSLSNSTNKKSASTQLISDFLTKVTGEGLKKEDLKASGEATSGTRVSFFIPFNTQEDD